MELIFLRDFTSKWYRLAIPPVNNALIGKSEWYWFVSKSISDAVLFYNDPTGFNKTRADRQVNDPNPDRVVDQMMIPNRVQDPLRIKALVNVEIPVNGPGNNEPIGAKTRVNFYCTLRQDQLDKEVKDL